MPSVPSNSVNLLNPTIPVDQSIYEVSTAQKARIGTRLQVGEKVFYYAKAAASVPGGAVLCAPAPTASHQSAILAVAAATAGARTLSCTSSAAVAANVYDEGMFGIATGATNGLGQCYKVSYQGSGTAGFTVKLYDGLAQAITSGVGYYLYPSPFNGVNIGSQVVDVPVGVAPLNVTSGAYFWMQTWGPAAAQHQGASAVAAALRLGTTGGLVAAFNATTNDATTVQARVIAQNGPLAATAAQTNPVFLTILP
jgi:hypothetical protein